MRHHGKFPAGIMALAILLSLALVICNLDHEGPMAASPAGHMGASGHSDSTALGCAGDACLMLASKALGSPEKLAGFLLFPILLLSSWFFADVRSHRDSSPSLQRFSFHPRFASNKRYLDLSVFLV
jgi:hypothetical protein